MTLLHMVSGTRVRKWFGDQPHYGVVTKVMQGPWVQVEFEEELPGFRKIQHCLAGELQGADEPLPGMPTNEAPF